MSTSPEPGAQTTEANFAAEPEIRTAAPTPPPQPDDPLELLRDAIDRLKSLNGGLPDQVRVANLLAEAREALERANLVASVVAQCEGLVKDGHFEQAFEALDVGLVVYPDDPLLVTRRREVEHQKEAADTAAAVRAAIEEANWLVDRDRIDMAVHFLKERAAELPAQPSLISRLEELKFLLPRWEQKREVQAALDRARMLEESQQWRAALTILEEMLRLHPAVDELNDAAERVRGQLVEHERKKKLARRLELIGQKIAIQSWKQALTLIEDTQKEFPECQELDALQREAAEGLRHSEREAIIAEVRQCVVDGELDQAEQALRRGFESLGPEPALEALREELESHRTSRDALGKAQILFAQRQFADAERVLAQLANREHPEAQALLIAVQKARSAAEEEAFCEQGRKKAEELIHQGQFGQAADLLHNLLSLFPGNPILERDLAAARSRLHQGLPPVIAAVNEGADSRVLPAELRPTPEFVPGVAPAPVSGFSGSRRLLMAVGGVLVLGALVLVSTIGLAGKRTSRRSQPSAPTSSARVRPGTEAAAVQASPAIAEVPKGVSPEISARQSIAASSSASASTNRRMPEQPSVTTPPRQFVPVAARNTSPQSQDSRLPAPPAETVISTPAISALPAELVQTVSPPAPPQVVPRRSPPPAPAVSAERLPQKGGDFQKPQLLRRTMPQYPSLARQLRVTGMVRLEARVDEYGNVRDVKVLNGHPTLAAAARNAVLQWRYKPATLDGRAIATTVAVEIMFRGENQ